MKKILHPPFATAILLLTAVALPCAANVVWFDETGGGRGFSHFNDLAAAYGAFMGPSATTIDFNDLAGGTILSDQYQARYGVAFANTSGGRYGWLSTIHSEDDACVQTLTGYDGSYMPNGDNVVLKFDNNLSSTPFSIRFDSPVATVGAFVGMGVEGPVHALQISAYDASGALVGRRDVQSWLWETDPSMQNYESFFALTADRAVISRVDILNEAQQDFANALIVDNLAFAGRPGSHSVLPEPATAAFLTVGTFGILFVGRRRSANRSPPAGSVDIPPKTCSTTAVRARHPPHLRIGRQPPRGLPRPDLPAIHESGNFRSPVDRPVRTGGDRAESKS